MDKLPSSHQFRHQELRHTLRNVNPDTDGPYTLQEHGRFNSSVLLSCIALPNPCNSVSGVAETEGDEETQRRGNDFKKDEVET